MYKRKYTDILPYMLILFCTGLMMYRAQFSFCESDECFYYASARQLYMGENLILDLWHPTQFYTPLLLPFIACVYSVSAMGTGLLLAGRITMLALTCISALVAYRILKKHTSKTAACISCLIYMQYIRGSIYGLSYYSLCTFFSLLAILMFVCCAESGNPVYSGLCAVFSAFATLCMPYLAAAIVAVYLLFAFFYRGNKRKSVWLYGICILVLAFLYILFFLTKGSLSEYVQNLPQLVQDGEHTDTGLQSLLSTLAQLREAVSCEVPAVIILTVSVFVKNNRFARIRPYLLVAANIVFTARAAVLSDQMETNMQIYWQYCFFGLPIMINSMRSYMRNRDPRCIIGQCLYWGGSLISAVFSMGSNVGIDCIGIGFSISSIGLTVETANLITLLSEKTSVSKLKAVFIGFITALFMLLLFVRMSLVYRDDFIENLNVRVTSGVASGLITTSEHAQRYYAINEALQEIQSEYPSVPIFYSKLLPWAYCSGNNPCAGYSAWRIPLSDTRLELYYTLNREKFPGIVVIFDDEVGSSRGHQFSGDFPNQNPREGFLWDEICSKGYRFERYPYMDVYISPDL